ncbi:hypothetical protein KKH27_11150 [bacterium]|nr:hypothetical protein [bacterium]MBU1984478.1 hypothetical protein [bacterium]
MWISPKYQRSDFPEILEAGHMILIFEDRTLGWQIDIAAKCCDLEEGAFASLHIIMSYFEMIAQYERGENSNFRLAEFFERGILSVFPQLREMENYEDIVRNLQNSRNGLYHSGMTREKVLLTDDTDSPISNDQSRRVILINPKLLISAVQDHFVRYITRLKSLNDSDQSLTRFVQRFREEFPKINMLAELAHNDLSLDQCSTIPKGVSIMKHVTASGVPQRKSL